MLLSDAERPLEFLKAPYSDGVFDVIVATELLEHLKNPLPFIRKAHALLASNGVLFLTTPKGNGISGRLLGLDWSAMAPPEHLNLFSPQSLGFALASQGFKSTRIDCEGVNPYEFSTVFAPSILLLWLASPPTSITARPPLNSIAD